MKMRTPQRPVLWVIMITLLCLTLSSCSFFEKYTDKGKINSTVNSYLSDIQSGVFVFDKYQSKYASDQAFSKLKYFEDDAEIIMKISMHKITFEIGDISADKGNKTGTCSVSISAIDVQKMLEAFGDVTPDYDTLLEAVEDKDVAKSEHTISLTVAYDSADKMWKVQDSLPLVEIIAKPYTELIFYPDPTETVNILIAAVNATDYAELEERSGNMSWPLPEDEAEKKMEEVANKKAVFEIVADPIIKDNKAEVKIKVTSPDFQIIVDEFMEDVEFWATYLKPVLLDAINGVEDPNTNEKLEKMLVDEFVERIEDPNTGTMSVETTMELKFDQESNSWVLIAWDFRSYMDINIADDAELSEDMVYQSGTRALEMLLEEGEISKSEYNQYLTGFQK